MHSALHIGGFLLSMGLAHVASAQTWRTVSSARQLSGEQSLDVDVEYGLGKLQLRPAEGAFLYQMEARYDADRFTPVAKYARNTGQLRLGIKGEGNHRKMTDGGRFTVRLSREVPVSLNLEFGAGEADLELGDLNLRRVDVATGASETHIHWGRPNRSEAEHVHVAAGAASLRVTGLGNARAARYSFDGGVGETTLDFTGTWTRSATATVDMGIGSVTLRFPRSLGVRINKDSFLTHFDAEGMEKRGKAFFSRNWNAATHRLSVDVDAAIGSVRVEWADT